MKKIVYMLVLLILPMIVSATNYTAEDMTIDIGDNWMVFTRDNLENNENPAKFGVDENTMKVQMNTFGMYIDAISTFDNVNYTEMFVFVKSTDEETMNLHKYKDEDALEVGKTLYNKYKPTRMELYKTKRLTYIVAEYTDKVNNKTLYVTDYYTVINGRGYTIKIQSPSEYNSEARNNIEKMIISISFKLNKKYEKSPYSHKFIYIIVCAIIGGILGGIIAFLKNKKNKLEGYR